MHPLLIFLAGVFVGREVDLPVDDDNDIELMDNGGDNGAPPIHQDRNSGAPDPSKEVVDSPSSKSPVDTGPTEPIGGASEVPLGFAPDEPVDVGLGRPISVQGRPRLLGGV